MLTQEILDKCHAELIANHSPDEDWVVILSPEAFKLLHANQKRLIRRAMNKRARRIWRNNRRGK